MGSAEEPAGTGTTPPWAAMAHEPLNKNNSSYSPYTEDRKGPLVTAEADQVGWKEDGCDNHRHNENSLHYTHNISVSPKVCPYEKLKEKA